MSDIPSGAIEDGQSRAVSLLARVILPRPGEPLDVRKLYIEESDTNARRAHAPTRTELEIGAESEVSFATYFNAFPRELLAPVVDAGVGGASGRVDRQRARRRLPLQGDGGGPDHRRRRTDLQRKRRSPPLPPYPMSARAPPWSSSRSS